MKNICKITTGEFRYVLGIKPKKGFIAKLIYIFDSIACARSIATNEEETSYCVSARVRLIPALLLIIPLNVINFFGAMWYDGLRNFKPDSLTDMIKDTYSNYAFVSDLEIENSWASRYVEVIKKHNA